MFCQSGGLPYRRGPNSEGSKFHQSRGVSIQRGPIVVNPEGSYFCQLGGVLELYFFDRDLRDPNTYAFKIKIKSES